MTDCLRFYHSNAFGPTWQGLTITMRMFEHLLLMDIILTPSLSHYVTLTPSPSRSPPSLYNSLTLCQPYSFTKPFSPSLYNSLLHSDHLILTGAINITLLPTLSRMHLLTLVLQGLLLQGLVVLTPLAASSSSRGPSKDTNDSILKLSIALQELVESLREGETGPTPPPEPGQSCRFFLFLVLMIFLFVTVLVMIFLDLPSPPTENPVLSPPPV